MSYWSFAKVNNKLAEIYFEESKSGPKITGHCYVKASEYNSKKEKHWIETDTKKFQFIYRDGHYKKVKDNPNLNP